MIQRYAAAVANPFLGNLPGKADMGLYDICWNPEHYPNHCPLLQKYSSSAGVTFCNLYRATIHRTEDFRALSALVTRFEKNLFAVETAGDGNRSQNQGHDNRVPINYANQPPLRCSNCHDLDHIACNWPAAETTAMRSLQED
jgi:hypothetical protein